LPSVCAVAPGTFVGGTVEGACVVVVI
jgi:hypothetical protein